MKNKAFENFKWAWKNDRLWLIKASLLFTLALIGCLKLLWG